MTGVWPGHRDRGVRQWTNARLRESCRERTGALTHALSRLSTAVSLADVTTAVGHAVRRLMSADGATFVLREDDSCFYVDEDVVAALWKGCRFPIDDCISGWAMLHREVVLVPDVRVDSRIPQDVYRATFVRSLCMAPIGAGEPVGALGAYWREEHTPSPSEVRLLSVLANSAAVALENLELRAAVDRRSAERDVLSARRDELELAVHSMAHDLRSPLGAVLGYAELLEDELADDADAVRQVGRTIRMAGQRMAGQIDQMLALYRVTSGSVLPTTIDLTAMARSIIEDLVGVEEQREIETEVAEGMVVRADAELTHLMLHNLLNNALKFTRHRPVTRIEVGGGGLPGDGNPLPPGWPTTDSVSSSCATTASVSTPTTPSVVPAVGAAALRRRLPGHRPRPGLGRPRGRGPGRSGGRSARGPTRGRPSGSRCPSAPIRRTPARPVSRPAARDRDASRSPVRDRFLVPGCPCVSFSVVAPLAQSAERLHGKEKVYGSIP